MDFITNILSAINGVVWGVPMLVSILGISLLASFDSFLPIRKLEQDLSFYLKNDQRSEGQNIAI